MANERATVPNIGRVQTLDWLNARIDQLELEAELRATVPEPEEVCGRNWNWPGSSTDREPYGVIAHEVGHCADWFRSGDEGLPRGAYGGMVSRLLREESGEKPLTSYCPNDAEWFAEHFRLFVTNHALLAILRPRTHSLFMERWKPVSHDDWRVELTDAVPARIIRAILNKAPKPRVLTV